jgi:hypothetical protein
MLEQRRARVMKAGSFIFGVLGISLVYFLFFNMGLELFPDPDNSLTRVVVRNDSQHRIREISVSFMVNQEKKEAQSISFLDPQQEQSIFLDPQYASTDSFVVQVSAPFHLSKQIVVASEKAILENANVQFTFVTPSIAYVNQSTQLQVKVCNNELYSLPLQTQLVALEEGSVTLPPAQEWSFPPLECEVVSILVTPLEESPDLSFKIRVFTPSTVLAERVVSMQVISNSSNTGADQNA